MWAKKTSAFHIHLTHNDFCRNVKSSSRRLWQFCNSLYLLSNSWMDWKDPQHLFWDASLSSIRIIRSANRFFKIFICLNGLNMIVPSVTVKTTKYVVCPVHLLWCVRCVPCSSSSAALNWSKRFHKCRITIGWHSIQWGPLHRYSAYTAIGRGNFGNEGWYCIFIRLPMREVY